MRPATGDAILQLALAHEGEKYVLGARAPMANAGWHGPWDCAEFASWCLYQASGILFGVEPRNDPVRADAYSGFWVSQAREAGATISIEQAARIAGAFVVRVPMSSRVGHIVISDGKGGTIEAHSSNTGVIRNTLAGRRWDLAVLVPGIDYAMGEDEVHIAPPARVIRLTQPITSGTLVRKIQVALISLGYAVGSVDGKYGPQTESAVQGFQNDRGLVPDGEVGERTLAALGLG